MHSYATQISLMPLSAKGNLEVGLESKVQCAAVDVGSIIDTA